MPKRIQRKRTKGWRMPQNTVNCTRPGILGNPFTIAQAREVGYVGTDAELAGMCVDCFRDWLLGSDKWWMGPESEKRRAAILARVPHLRDNDVACFCPLDQACHADVLLDLANKDAD